MKNIKSTIAKLLLGAIVVTGFTSCDDEERYEDYDQSVAARPALAMSGEWFIDITDEATGALQVAHARHKTYDSNDGQLWISDHIGPPGRYTAADFSGWWLFGKVNYNLANLTFSNSNLENIADGSIVNITDGKILKNATTTAAGVVTDSIYFKGSFDYAPSQVLIFAGHKRTGLLEDE